MTDFPERYAKAVDAILEDIRGRESLTLDLWHGEYREELREEWIRLIREAIEGHSV